MPNRNPVVALARDVLDGGVVVLAHQAPSNDRGEVNLQDHRSDRTANHIYETSLPLAGSASAALGKDSASHRPLTTSSRITLLSTRRTSVNARVCGRSDRIMRLRSLVNVGSTIGLA